MAVLLTPMHAVQQQQQQQAMSSSDFASSQKLALTAAGRGCETACGLLHSPSKIKTTREEHAGSAESLTSLLAQLPDIVIPELIQNPLPLQCLAASALPETIREEIDRVLAEYSVMASSPRHLLSPNAASANSSGSSSSTAGAVLEEIGRHQVAGSGGDQLGGHDGAAKEVSLFVVHGIYRSAECCRVL